MLRESSTACRRPGTEVQPQLTPTRHRREDPARILSRRFANPCEPIRSSGKTACFQPGKVVLEDQWLPIAGTVHRSRTSRRAHLAHTQNWLGKQRMAPMPVQRGKWRTAEDRSRSARHARSSEVNEVL